MLGWNQCHSVWEGLVHGLIQLIMSLSLLDEILFLNQRMLWYCMQKLIDERQIFE